jgi:hypothetical protein
MTDLLLQCVLEAAVFMLPLTLSLLVFVWHKKRQQRILYLYALQFGIWKSGGERIEY